MTVSKDDHYVYQRENRIISSSVSGTSNKAAFLGPKRFRSTFFSNTNSTSEGEPNLKKKKKHSHIQDIIYSSVFLTICLELIHWTSAVGLYTEEKPRFKVKFIKRTKERISLRA